MRRTCITLLLLLSLPIAAFPWLASEAKLRRLIQLSVGPQQQQQAEGYLLQWQTKPWTIQFIGIGQGQFDIAQYHAVSLQAAKEKLLQFPRGSSFHWTLGGQLGEEKAAIGAIHVRRGPRDGSDPKSLATTPAGALTPGKFCFNCL